MATLKKQKTDYSIIVEWENTKKPKSFCPRFFKFIILHVERMLELKLPDVFFQFANPVADIISNY